MHMRYADKMFENNCYAKSIKHNANIIIQITSY